MGGLCFLGDGGSSSDEEVEDEDSDLACLGLLREAPLGVGFLGGGPSSVEDAGEDRDCSAGAGEMLLVGFFFGGGASSSEPVDEEVVGSLAGCVLGLSVAFLREDFSSLKSVVGELDAVRVPFLGLRGRLFVVGDSPSATFAFDLSAGGSTDGRPFTFCEVSSIAESSSCGPSSEAVWSKATLEPPELDASDSDPDSDDDDDGEGSGFRDNLCSGFLMIELELGLDGFFASGSRDAGEDLLFGSKPGGQYRAFSPSGCFAIGCSVFSIGVPFLFSGSVTICRFKVSSNPFSTALYVPFFLGISNCKSPSRPALLRLKV